MRRFLALIIMLVVPLQFAWSAALSVHGHVERDAVGMHVHDHDHHDLAHAGHALADPDHSEGDPPGEDNHHGSHCHHVFSFILHQHDAPAGLGVKDGPIQHLPAAFVSRIPPLLDRPPLVRA